MLYALSVQTGEKLWSYRTGGAITTSPAVVEDLVYVGSDDHSLYAFHRTPLPTHTSLST